MKNRKTRTLALVLAVVMAFGLAAPALAAGQTFSDVPESYWGYADIEAVAEAGLMNGTGNGAFSPEMKVSVAQFLTLLGRLVFPDVKTEGSDWFGPYVAAAQEAGLLTGSQVDVNNVEAEISRYDMAVILRAAAKKLGVAEKTAQSSEVTDYLDVPTRYAEAVLAVYGMGLIKGDQAGNFNGSNTMMRAEVATVIMRLAKTKPGGGTQGGGADPSEIIPPQATPTPTPEIPAEPVMVTAETWGSILYYPTQGNGSWDKDATKVTSDGIPFKILYTEDGGETSTLMGEGETTGVCSFELEFPVDKQLLDNPNGQFYISTQFEKDGQRFVTQNLRTDGRQALSLVRVYEKGHGRGGDFVKLVPPGGQRWDFELKGKVPNEARVEPNFTTPVPPDWHDISPAGFTVQLVYYPESNLQDLAPTGKRIVIAETKANEDCTFVMPVSIDTVDMVSTESFRIEFRGWYNGVEYFSRNTDELKTLSDIKTTPINAAWGVNLYHN